MIAQIPPEIAALFDTKHLVWITAVWLLLQNLGRVYHAVVSGGGLVSIYRALIYGTNVPTVKQVVAETVRQEVIAEKKANV